MAMTFDPIEDFRGDLSEQLYPTGAINALIMVESCGQESSQRSKFYGLLQMSPIYLTEIGLKPEDVMSRFGAIAAFYIMQRRYRVRRKGTSEMAIPIFHKSGPRTWKRWRRLVSQGYSDMEAVRMLNKPGLERFLRKYFAARSGNAKWCGEVK
jgi:hypothetical protein